jgi:YVTN family beta-propeller protein
VRRGSASFDSAAFSTEIDRLIARCTPELIARAPELGSSRCDAGADHRHAAVRHNSGRADRLHASRGRGRRRVEFLERARGGVAPLRRGRERDAACRIGEFLAKAAADYLGVLRAIAPKAARVTDKMPFNFLWAGLIHLAFPRATIIHCRRAAIDTALSIHQTHFHPTWRFRPEAPNWSRISALPAAHRPLADRAAGGSLHRGRLRGPDPRTRTSHPADHRGLRPGVARRVPAPRIESAGCEDSQQVADPAADLSHLRRALATLRTLAGAAARARRRQKSKEENGTCPEKLSRRNSRKNLGSNLRPLAGLLAAGLSLPGLAAAQSKEYPTYVTGPQSNGSWVVSSGQIITPAGTQVNLGIRVRAKAIAVNPNLRTHTAAVLTMGASEAVEVFDTNTGVVLQNYITFGTDSSGSYSGIAYSADGKHLVFSQDSSNVTIAKVTPQGLLEDDAQISVPPNNSFITCFPNSPPGAYAVPCGTFYSPSTSYPGGVALSQDGKSAYALLNQNDTLAQIDLTTNQQGTQIRVGNAPHSIVIDSNGTTAYVSNEGGRAATEADFQIWSAGTEIVADPVVGAAITGTVSVVDLASMTVTANISTGLHPTGMAFYGKYLLVANTYSDTISVIDTTTNEVAWTINLGLPIGVPGAGQPAYGAAPNSIAVDAEGVAYVALYNANAIGVVDLSKGATNPVVGMIPVAYAPSSVVLDRANNALIVANDKGIGTRYSFECDYGVCDYNTHQDNGTVSIVPVPNSATLATMTKAGFPEQPLGSDAKYPVCLRWQPEDQAGRNPGQDRRSVADQARVPDHP